MRRRNPSDRSIRDLERQVRQGIPGAAARYESALAQAGRPVDYRARAMEIMNALQQSQGGDHPYAFADTLDSYSQREWRFSEWVGDFNELGKRFLVVENGVCRSSEELWAHSFDTEEEALDHVQEYMFGADFRHVSVDNGMFPWYPRVVVDLLLMQPLDLRACFEFSRPHGKSSSRCGPWLMPEARSYWARSNPPPGRRRAQASELERLVRQGREDLWPQLVQAREREGLMPGRAWLRSLSVTWNDDDYRDAVTGEWVPYTEGDLYVPGLDHALQRLGVSGRRRSLQTYEGDWYKSNRELYMVFAQLHGVGDTGWNLRLHLFDSPRAMAGFEVALDLVPQPGDRVQLISMADDPDPVMSGEHGTVTSAQAFPGGDSGWVQVSVNWDSGRGLMLASPPDRFRILSWGGLE